MGVYTENGTYRLSKNGTYRFFVAPYSDKCHIVDYQLMALIAILSPLILKSAIFLKKSRKNGTIDNKGRQNIDKCHFLQKIWDV